MGSIGGQVVRGQSFSLPEIEVGEPRGLSPGRVAYEIISEESGSADIDQNGV